MEYNAQYRTNHKNEIKIYEKKRTHSLNTRYKTGKWRANKIKREFSISFKDWIIIIRKGCHYCGKSLQIGCGISLDRIDNSKGYNLKNVLPCCTRDNMGRGNRFTVKEWEVMVKAYVKYKAKNLC